MSGKRSRRKGHDFEREVARRLRELWPGAKRGAQYDRLDRPADVEGTPFRLECKVGARPDVWAALEQVVGDGRRWADPRPPVVVARRHACTVQYSRRPRRDVVVMLFDDWLELVRKAGIHAEGDEE